MRITLLRHGQPEFRLAGRARASELRSLAQSYDASGIVGAPPQAAVVLARSHRLVCCSNLPRAMASARALGCGDAGGRAEALFRETAMPYFDRGAIALPVAVWVVVLRLFWVLGFSRNGESYRAMKQRSAEAARRLMHLASEHGSVLLVGHGLMNRYIAKELRVNGWSGPSQMDMAYWAAGSYDYMMT